MNTKNIRKATATELKAEATVLAMKVRFNEGVREYQAYLLRNYRIEDVVRINYLVTTL